MPKYQHGHYYWVRRRPNMDGEGKTSYPNWEPMLWDSDTEHFHSRCDTKAYAPEDLKKVGEWIGNGPRNRVTRKGWMPTTHNRLTGKADPCPEEVRGSKRAAQLCADGPPIPVEVSWSRDDHNDANRKARKDMRR